jgi:GTPases - Sulfate adenylate transferase subunit 1
VLAGIDTADGPLTEAGAGRSVVLRLADHVDVGRGDLLAADPLPVTSRELDAVICWLAETPLRPGDRYRVRHTTRDVPGVVTVVHDRLDVSTLDASPAEELGLNDIGHATLRLAEPVVAEPYVDCRATGALLLVDEHTGATVAAGMVRGFR